ncbi:MAG: glycosyltransferase family 4 protein [Bacteroidales bacterium]|nr:glycosyltransferase family 4 protein [Bacteroidales bacterium]
MKQKTIILGPSLNAKGGIVSVVKALLPYYSSYTYITTSSMKGVLINSYTLIKSLCQYLFVLIFNDVDIVHIHSASNNSFKRKSLFIRISKCFNVKIIVHMHGGSFKDFYKKNKKLVQNCLGNENVSIIALTESWKNFFESEFNAHKVWTLPNPISRPEAFHVSCNDKLTFLFVGRISKEKGCYDLVNAISEIKSNFVGKVEFRLAGLGDIDDLDKIIFDKGINQIVKCIGWADGEKLRYEYLHADCFILPSYIEGLPVSILEAMSYKLPIISTTVGGIPEIVDKTNGFLVEPGNICALKEVILSFLTMSKEQKEQMALNSYRKSKAYFIEEVVEKLEKIYQEVID